MEGITKTCFCKTGYSGPTCTHGNAFPLFSVDKKNDILLPKRTLVIYNSKISIQLQIRSISISICI